jgi:invasion protein IalB
MKSRMLKLTATASATVLLAGFGAVAATSASAATAPAAAVTHTAAVPMGAPVSAHHPAWWPWCEIDLLGPVLCINL